ncbi:hypothetical protein [Halorientalis sp.]|jgi:hypothetical protein|uniref:hypothetical protein n=1 Tax=Halorientalis sp. TaxID=1931229 RepID=UPI0026136E0D|nr:hypothetical protein [Halorientalis sp.]
MFSIGDRQVIIAVLLAATMVLAGCSGGGGPTPTDGGTDSSTDADAEAGVSADSYQWAEGESYTYESDASQGSSSRYTWVVTDVNDGAVTAELTSSFGSQSQTVNITGPQGDVFNGTDQNPPQSFTFVLLQIPQALIQGETLEPGNSWTVSSDEFQVSGAEPQEQSQEQSQEVNVSVTGTSQIQGTQCYDVEVSTANETFSACVREDWPFALEMTFTLQSQTTTYTLVDFDRP